LDTYDFLADPRAITLQARRATAARMAREQNHWLARLQQLTEPPGPDHDFPAFLLATPHFADLARRVGDTTDRTRLPVAVADELDWFVDAFRDYLRTNEGEDVFSPDHRMRA
jgi:hypothetical protein